MIEITLYNAINRATAKEVISRIKEAAGADILLRIHSEGGSVFDGNLIFNALKTYEGKVNVRIDGIAASMAAMIAMAAASIAIVDNGFIMLHAPSVQTGGTSGALQRDAQLLTHPEKHFTTILLQRVGAKQARSWMDGKDYWFTAKEAQTWGLVDKIIPAMNASLSISKAEVVKYPQQYYSAFLDSKNSIMTVKTKNKALTILSTLGVQLSETNADTDTLIGVLTEQLEREHKHRVEVEAQLSAHQKNAIDTLIKEAIATKRISEAQAKTFIAIGTTSGSGIDMLREALQAITPPVSSLSSHCHNDPTSHIYTKGWSWDEWQANDPRGLEKMEKDNPEHFHSLYTAKYQTL